MGAVVELAKGQAPSPQVLHVDMRRLSCPGGPARRRGPQCCGWSCKLFSLTCVPRLIPAPKIYNNLAFTTRGGGVQSTCLA